MTASVARLRPVPAIEFEPSEGRLRRHTAEGGLQDKAQGADTGGPRWSQDIYDVQMRARVAVTLVEEMYRNMRAMEDIHQIRLEEEIGFNEVSFQVHDLRKAAEALQPN